nr:hypothetical protein GCM10020093_113030 [Planobispora longispora]
MLLTVPCRGEDLRRGAEVEGHDLVECEDGDAVTSHGRILSCDGFPAASRKAARCATFVGMRRNGARPGLHWAWVVAAVTFVALVGAAGFRATPAR